MLELILDNKKMILIPVSSLACIVEGSGDSCQIRVHGHSGAFVVRASAQEVAEKYRVAMRAVMFSPIECAGPVGGEPLPGTVAPDVSHPDAEEGVIAPPAGALPAEPVAQAVPASKKVRKAASSVK